MSEGSQPDFMEALPLGVKELSEEKLYGDVPHGFAAGRGDWVGSALKKQRAEEVIQDYVCFVQKILAV